MSVRKKLKSLLRKEKKGSNIDEIVLKINTKDKDRSVLPLVQLLLKDPDGKKIADLLKKSKINHIWEVSGKWKN